MAGRPLSAGAACPVSRGAGSGVGFLACTSPASSLELHGVAIYEGVRLHVFFDGRYCGRLVADWFDATVSVTQRHRHDREILHGRLH